MPRAIWSGSISFGLVNIPVKLYSAVRDREVHFHMLHQEDGQRIKQQLVCPAEDKVVSRSDVVKGYEVSADQYVVVTDDELEALEPKATRMIEMLDFVKISEIDPVFFQHPYYLVPDEQSGKAYGLLLTAMRDSERIGVGKLVMRGKEYLVAIRPYDTMIVLETMHFAEEVVSASDIEEMPEQPEATERELKLAGQIIDALADSFDPARYHDDYRDAVRALIDSKVEGREYVMPPPVEEEGKVIDLMAALEKSLARAREQKGGASRPAKKEKAS
jgi:DNA end-binding protein Ku